MASKKVNCPQCKKETFSADLVKAVGQCFSCGHSAGGFKLLSQLNTVKEAYRPTSRVSGAYPTLSSPGGDGAAYLASRGVTPKQAETYGIKWAARERELYFPIWSPFCDKGSYVRRKIDSKSYYNDGEKNRSYLFGRKEIKRHDRVIIVEGIFGVLTPLLWGQGVALLGSDMSDTVEMWLQQADFEQIVLWLDPDLTGIKKAQPIAAQLRKWHPRVLVVHGWAFDPRDPGDYRMDDAMYLLYEAQKQNRPTPTQRKPGC